MRCLQTTTEAAVRFSIAAKGPVWHQLVVFPHAGGSVEFYADWRKHLPADVDLIVIRYPRPAAGAGASGWEHAGPAIAACRRSLAGLLGLAPISFFGHSMGALLALHVAAAMGGTRFHSSQLIISAQRTPQAIMELLDTREARERFVEAALSWAPDGQAAAYTDEVRDYLGRVMQADLQLLRQLAALELPGKLPMLRLFGGLDDPLVSLEQLAAWRRLLPGAAEPEAFAGGHFYHAGQIADVIQAVLGCDRSGRDGAPDADPSSLRRQES